MHAFGPGTECMPRWHTCRPVTGSTPSLAVKDCLPVLGIRLPVIAPCAASSQANTLPTGSMEGNAVCQTRKQAQSGLCIVIRQFNAHPSSTADDVLQADGHAMTGGWCWARAIRNSSIFFRDHRQS